MATSTTLRRKEHVKPFTGRVRWLHPLIIGKQLGRISITNANNQTPEYDVDAFTDADGAIRGLGLAKNDDKIYSIDTTAGFGWVCECADCQFRNRECKHIKAVRAALANAGICAPTRKRQQLEPNPEEKCEYYCPECRTWSDSVFCPKCPI